MGLPLTSNDLSQYCVFVLRGTAMGKKKSKNLKTGVKRTATDVKSGQANQSKQKGEDHDFGGLPNINFKKNLGCG